MDRRQKADGDHPGSGTRSSSGQNPRNRGTLEAERSPTRLGHREQRTKQPRQPAVGAPRGGGANHRRNLRRAIVHLRSPRSDEWEGKRRGKGCGNHHPSRDTRTGMEGGGYRNGRDTLLSIIVTGIPLGWICFFVHTIFGGSFYPGLALAFPFFSPVFTACPVPDPLYQLTTIIMQSTPI
jgi:hypothetical protein